MVETLQAAGEFEQKPNREVEKKYLPLFPESLDRFRADAVPIEQLYLSHPKEPFSLRLRETISEDGSTYTATLKDRGKLTTDGIDRLEVETIISHDTYLYYRELELPMLRKLRAEPYKHIAIDWFEGGHVQIEAENPVSMVAFSDNYRLHLPVSDLTGDRLMDNEWRAHRDFRHKHNGEEALVPSQTFDAERAARQIWERVQAGQCIATIAGRSGSGKSTVITEIQSILKHNGVYSIVLSTDDYHRGKTWLENHNNGPWSDWEARIVYDLDALSKDLGMLCEKRGVLKRKFDFDSQEPVATGQILELTPIIIIEGIYAGDATFDKFGPLRYEIPTPLATCVGRRVLRDLQERPQFANPSDNLRYILEKVEPSYQSQRLKNMR